MSLKEVTLTSNTKLSVIFGAKLVYLGIIEKGNSRQTSYAKTIGKSNKHGRGNFMEKWEEAVKGCFGKSAAEKQEFRLMVVPHWLSCWGS